MRSRGNFRHGHAFNGNVTPTYQTWKSVLRRARTEPGYIERGMDPRWMQFSNFLQDMGERPTISHQIDRIDNTRGYWPDNCRWVTPREQALNRSSNRLVRLGDDVMPLTVAAEKLGLSISTIYSRLRRGHPLTTAMQPGCLDLTNRSRNDSNKSNSRRIEINGEIKHLNEWLRIVGLTKEGFYHRVKNLGLSEQEAILHPSRKAKKVSS